MSARGFGWGKLILCGEHAVVYGHPALALAVDRGTQVTLEARPGPTAIDGGSTDPRLGRALRAALPAEGWAVHINTDLPVGRGMGSSAALAVALVRALAAHRGEALDADQVFTRAMPVERVFHGNPSGLDVAVSARGGVLSYRRGPPARITPLPTRPAGRIVVYDTGLTGNTANLVAGVGARRPGIDPALERIGALVGEAVAALDRPEQLGPLLVENHRLLGEIGVSTPELDDLVRIALEAGAWGAKLSGAGGGGVVIALAAHAEPLLEAAERRGIAALHCHPVEAA